MGALIVWTAVMLLTVVGISLTMSLGESIWRGGILSTLPIRVAAFAVAAVALILLGGLWKVHAIARADAKVIEELATKRNDEVVLLMKAFTTIGDAIPSLVIAAMLAVLIYQQGHHRVLCFMLPLLVLLELFLQIGMTNAFHDLTIGKLSPGTPLGGVGTVPSGSVARLSSLFLTAACLWSSTGVRAPRVLVGLGGVLLVLQVTSRVYLGRHLLGDILGGLLLGLLLTIVSVTVVQFLGRRPRELEASAV